MNPHDVTATTPEGLVCACGRILPTREAHEAHYGVERARAALRGEEKR